MSERIASWLNAMSADNTRETMRRCCGSTAWCEAMVAARPYSDDAAITAIADAAFDAMSHEAWLEAFTSHPKIGDLNSLRMKFAGNKEWSGGEQSGVNAADDATLQGLADGNRAYEELFGYLFIVCATGKTAAEMLAILQSRLGNDPETEFSIAAGEQRKITHLRLAKLEPTQV
jgi:2-oxo-4-hydroxy-4-carboxy-5-ureidoimidazoline decarboxylase